MIRLEDFFPDGVPDPGGPPLFPGGKRPLHELLDWPDLESILATACFEGSASAAIADALGLDPGPGRVCILRGGAEIWRVPRRISEAEFEAGLRGASLRVEAVEEVHPPVRAFANALQRAAPAVYCNAYAAWGAEPGLGIHYDYTDVLVLQLRGSKQWSIYRPTRAAIRGPESSAYKYRLQQAERGETSDRRALDEVHAGLFWEGVLDEGEALYLPPGWIHSVRPTGGPTLHLTCAFRAPPGSGGRSPRITLPEALRADSAAPGTAS